MKEIRELTKAEEQIIKVVWQLEKATIKEITDQLVAPKPAYNTVATVLKVLKSKGFVDFKSNSNVYLYYPLGIDMDEAAGLKPDSTTTRKEIFVVMTTRYASDEQVKQISEIFRPVCNFIFKFNNAL